MKTNGRTAHSEHPTRKYPIQCIECGQNEVRPAVIAHRINKNHDGRIYPLFIRKLPVTRCDACGEIYYTNDTDDKVSEALRQRLGLLTPEEIADHLKTLKMTQKAAASRLGVAAETLSRWIGGTMIQSRAMDNLLRAFFGYKEVREKLLVARR
jgi:DNA-binding transcriptional regulator YiaG